MVHKRQRRDNPNFCLGHPLGLPKTAFYNHAVARREKHIDDLSGKFRSVGWLLIIAVAVLGISLLLRQQGVF